MDTMRRSAPTPTARFAALVQIFATNNTRASWGLTHLAYNGSADCQSSLALTSEHEDLAQVNLDLVRCHDALAVGSRAYFFGANLPCHPLSSIDSKARSLNVLVANCDDREPAQVEHPGNGGDKSGRGQDLDHALPAPLPDQRALLVGRKRIPLRQ